MNEKEKAEAYVRRELPELMELSFGCAFRHKQDHDDHHFIFHCSESHPFLFVAKTDGTSGHYIDFDKREYEIIGHPIQLQHWIEAIWKSKADLKHLTRKLEFDPRYKTVYHEVDNIAMTAWFIKIQFDGNGQPATEADYQAFNQIVGI